jgi:hypothetical protein
MNNCYYFCKNLYYDVNFATTSFVVLDETFISIPLKYEYSNIHKNPVPHSKCSLMENPKFLQNFRSKNNTFKEKFCQIFLFNVCHYISGLAFKS